MKNAVKFSELCL